MRRRLFAILSALSLLPLALCGCAATPKGDARPYVIDKTLTIGESYQIPTRDLSELKLTLLETDGTRARFSLRHTPLGYAVTWQLEEWGNMHGGLSWDRMRESLDQQLIMYLPRVEGNTAVVRIGFPSY